MPSILTVFLTAFFIGVNLQVSRASLPVTDTVYIPFTHSRIIIDGSLDDWKTFTTRTFQDSNQWPQIPEGYSISSVYPGIDPVKIRLPLSRNSCSTRLCWDANNLYIAFVVNDFHLLGQWIGETENPYIYLNDAVEVYIDSKNDSKSRLDINDYQFIVDIHNQVVAMKGTISAINSDTLAVPKEPGQNLVFKSAVKINGKLNGYLDSTGRYIVEMKIPFISVGLEPASGATIRISLGAEDADFIYSDLTHPKDIYYNWAFDWAGYNDFGYPDVWKTAILKGRPSWYARISESYQRYWLGIILFLLVSSAMVIVVLFLYARRKARIPSFESLKQVGGGFSNGTPEQSAEEVSSGSRVMEEALKYVREHCKNEICSEDVARQLSISLRTLQRITREEMNCTPTGLILLVRVRMAAEYLLRKQGNVSQAAYEYGFTDPAYFSRVFKQHFGVSPSEYLTRNQA